MLTRNELLALNYYKKAVFTGSIGNMNYRIARIQPEAEGAEPVFEVVIFPGPYCFDKTADTLKQSARFPFSEEGIQAVTDYLNEQYAEQKALWDTV